MFCARLRSSLAILAILLISPGQDSTLQGRCSLGSLQFFIRLSCFGYTRLHSANAKLGVPRVARLGHDPAAGAACSGHARIQKTMRSMMRCLRGDLSCAADAGNLAQRRPRGLAFEVRRGASEPSVRRRSYRALSAGQVSFNDVCVGKLMVPIWFFPANLRKCLSFAITSQELNCLPRS